LHKYEFQAPVLDVCFGQDDNEAFVGGLDWDVRRLDLETGKQSVLSQHDAGVKSLVHSPQTSLLISASWDKTLHVHVLSPSDRTATTTPPSIIPLPSKPFSMSLSPSKLVLAMSHRLIHIYDVKSLSLLCTHAGGDPENMLSANIVQATPWQSRESSMKFMTRAVSCMPNDSGYASSSIEGRVAVEWFDPSEESQSRKYAFKCHRQTVDNVDVVYPVNALAFHPVHGTFASGGGDGVVALWDGVAKRRIRQYQKFPSSVASLAFSNDGKYLAVGVSPGFEDGQESENTEGMVKVFIRELSSDEARGKPKK